MKRERKIEGMIELHKKWGWKWKLFLPWGVLENYNPGCDHRSSAVRAARNAAAQLGVTVTKVENCGDEA